MILFFKGKNPFSIGVELGPVMV